MLESLSGAIGVATDVTERRRRDEERAFLAEASQLLGSSLDYDTTLATLASLTVPRLADWCSISLVEDERVRRVALCHADPAKRELVEQIHRGYPQDLADVSPVRAVLRTGRSLLRNDPSPEGLRAESRDTEEFRMVHDLLGFKSGMTVPMVCRGRTLGAISLVIADSDRRYDQTDLALGEELARRAALAVDNARLYREAQESISAREEFMSIASHELRAPLNTLYLQIQSLLRAGQQGGWASLPEDRLRGGLSACDRHVRRLGELINKLFDVTRIAAGRLELHLEDVDLAAVGREVVGRFAEELQRAGCAVSLRADRPVVGRWDRVRIEQVVVNLLQNAVKYGAGRPIEIVIDGDERMARLSVTDQGIGIAPEHHQRIFERFARVAADRGIGGLGMGLYIVNKILAALGGTIQVYSDLGAGSTFLVELPLVAEALADV